MPFTQVACHRGEKPARRGARAYRALCCVERVARRCQRRCCIQVHRRARSVAKHDRWRGTRDGAAAACAHAARRRCARQRRWRMSHRRAGTVVASSLRDNISLLGQRTPRRNTKTGTTKMIRMRKEVGRREALRGLRLRDEPVRQALRALRRARPEFLQRAESHVRRCESGQPTIRRTGRAAWVGLRYARD